MDYQYETLLDERFQMLCQSLLLEEYPDLQCYPVGMPDGGRDAVTPDASGGKVFQVKFARKPMEVKDPVKWITEAIDGEIEKVRKLAERGAASYILMTNMPGTSHLDSGRMDKVQDYMNLVLPVPGLCLWRDDLDRRLDVSYDLRLRYPNLLSGVDLIRLLWENTGVGEAQVRRQSALSAYLHDQSDRDSKVRFKQADLAPSPLFDLFIDVPAVPRVAKKRDAEKKYSEFERVARAINRKPSIASQHIDTVALYAVEQADEYIPTDGRSNPFLVGAAKLLLSHEFSTLSKKVVLEGAPGQGKSTLAQYIAQVQRARILEKYNSDGLPANIANSPLLLPFKIELRDLATWLCGIDPWTPGESTRHSQPCSLEGALAAHVSRYSGGVTFDVSDLLFVLERNASLIILDALDEVADLDDRQKVVDEVTAAAARLEGRCSGLKFIVTSRPTAVAGSPTFDSEKFYHLTLAAIRPNLALTYTKKWADARGLDHSEYLELRNTLRQKLEAPHMAELAKNTMQLSILLSLTHLRGSTLPDKRTELYDAYIDVFLNREAEKDRAVRENRELLVNIHQYLGYYLHARAEKAGASGRVSSEELQEILADFLNRASADNPFLQRRANEVLKSLLTGVVERVVALVSRVEGTYEFEVQPLREYFAAKYLYETAPYAPATRSLSGTKPERFEGIAANPYWMNVTRFFAGCFSMGELLDLADRTARMIEESELGAATYPRMLALCLLQDWVFTQSAASTKRIVEALFDNAGVRWAEVRDNFVGVVDYESGAGFRLSQTAGSESLLAHCWPLLTAAEESSMESIRAVCGLLRRQPEGEALAELWLQEVNHSGARLPASWLVIGHWLGVYRYFSLPQVQEVLDVVEVSNLDFALACLYSGGTRLGRIPSELRMRACLASLNYVGWPLLKKFYVPEDSIDFSQALDPQLWSHAMSSPHFSRIIKAEFREPNLASKEILALADVDELISLIHDIDPEGLTHNIDFWRRLTSSMRKNFGVTWFEISLGNISGAIKSPSERGAGAGRLFDENYSLPDRIRNAKRRAKQKTWWRGQLGEAGTEFDYGLWTLAAFSWCDPSVIRDLLPEVDQVVRDLGSQSFTALLASCRGALQYSKNARSTLALTEASLRSLDWRTVALILPKLRSDLRVKMAIKYIQQKDKDGLLGGAFLDYVSAGMVVGDVQDRSALNSISNAISAGIVSSEGFYGSDARRLKHIQEISTEVLEKSWSMPSVLIGAAYAVSDVQRRHKPVMDIAEEGSWFSHLTRD